MRNILLFIFFIILGLLATIGFNRRFFRNLQQTKPTTSSSFSLAEAPKNSVRGEIKNLNGDVSWQSRVATQPAQINKPQTIQQGEKLVTGDNGNISIKFNDSALIAIAAKSELSIIQTLPVNFVFEQPTGKVKYTKSGQTPISIRSLHLLISLNEGELTVTTDKEKSTVSVSVKSGSASVAYNNLQNLSTVKTIPKNKLFLFDDKTRKGVFQSL